MQTLIDNFELVARYLKLSQIAACSQVSKVFYHKINEKSLLNFYLSEIFGRNISWRHGLAMSNLRAIYGYKLQIGGNQLPLGDFVLIVKSCCKSVDGWVRVMLGEKNIYDTSGKIIFMIVKRGDIVEVHTSVCVQTMPAVNLYLNVPLATEFIEEKNFMFEVRADNIPCLRNYCEFGDIKLVLNH